MDSREILLILHLVGAFLLVGGAGAETALGIRAASSTSTRVIAAAMQMARAIENFVIMPGALAVIVFGTWLVIDLDREFSEAWLSAAYALWVVSLLLGNLVLGRHAKRVYARGVAMIAEGIEESEELRLAADETMPKVVGIGLNLLFIVFIYLMVAQPGA